jgi:hypothetical protein
MDIEVVKVPNERPSARPKKHGNSPRLYLELVENKERVRQDLINKEYVPPEELDVSLSDLEDDIPETHDSSIENDDDAEEETDPLNNISFKDKQNTANDRAPQSSRETRETRLDDALEDDSDASDTESDPFARKGQEPFSKEPGKQQDVALEQSSFATSPPPLAQAVGDIGARRYYRDIARVSVDEINEEDEKRQLLFKFEMLKKKYKESATLVPEYTVHSDLSTMQRSYEATLQRVVLDSTVEDYKSYFRTACWGIEWALNHFGFDISGFTLDQMSKMNSYERLLIELCEKHYDPQGSSVPVEIRLLGMILMNAAAFVAMRIVAKKFTNSMPKEAPPHSVPAQTHPHEQSSGMRAPTPNTPTQESFQQGDARRMRGPRPLDPASI